MAASADLAWIRAELRKLSSAALGRLARPFIEREICQGELGEMGIFELRLLGEALLEREHAA
jgi:hypothetical protein